MTALIFILKLYRHLIGPVVHLIVPVKSGCRFTPSCSERMELSLRESGLRAGIRDGMAQFVRCHGFHVPGRNLIVP